MYMSESVFQIVPSPSQKPDAVVDLTGTIPDLEAQGQRETAESAAAESEAIAGGLHREETSEAEELFGLPPEDGHGSVDYSPSVATNFSEPFEMIYSGVRTSLVAGYDADRVVSSAWYSLQQDDKSTKQVWEQGFWNQFFDKSTAVMDLFSQRLKRPTPYDVPDFPGAESGIMVEQRTVSKPRFGGPDFLQHVRDVPERTWQEEREALWETAIRRWVSLIDSWTTDSCELVRVIHSGSSFREKAQILVDVFYNKSPQTLMKRANSLSRITNYLVSCGCVFPCSESQCYDFFKRESASGAPAPRLKAIFEAMVFARHVLGVSALEEITNSRRCLGAASTSVFANLRQASPFKI